MNHHYAPRSALCVAFAFVLLAPASLLAQKGTYTAYFQYATGFSNNPIYSTFPAGGITTANSNPRSTFLYSFDPAVPASEAIEGSTTQVVLFRQPLRPLITTLVSYQAPFDTDPNRMFSVSLRLQVLDYGPFPALALCTQNGTAQSVRQGATTTLTLTLEGCTVPKLFAFNRSYVTNQTELQISASVVVNGATFSTDGFFAHYQDVPNHDATFSVITTPSPSALNALRGGTSQAFAGIVYGFPGTRFDADVRVLLVDSDLNVLGQTTPTRVTRRDTQKTFSMPAVPLPAITGNIYLLSVMTEPGTSNVLASDPTPVHLEACMLTGLIRRSAGGEDYWLPDVPVALYESPSNALLGLTRSKLTGTFDRPKSEYCFTASQLPAGFNPAGKLVYPLAIFQDADPDKTPSIRVSEKALVPGPLQVGWQPASIANSNRRDLNVDRNASILVAPPQSSLADVEAGAEVYWHLWRQAHVMWPANSGTPLKRNLPVNVFLNGTSTYYCPTGGQPPACPAPSANISLAAADSAPGASPSVVWHEFGHHLVKELYEADQIPRPAATAPDTYHNGYANAYTSDSIEEGFATFWAAATSRVFERDVKDRGKGMFRWNPPPGTSIFLESNDQMADPQTSQYPNPVPAREEYALAGVLWDLVDSKGDLERRYGDTFYDTATIELPDVLALLRTKPKSILDLYKAARTNHPTLAQGDPGQSKLDQIFLMHGAYYDTLGDGIFQATDEIGRAANGFTWTGYAVDAAGAYQPATLAPRPTREMLPQIGGSSIAVTLRDPAGATVPVSLVEVTIDHGPGYEALSTKETLRVSGGNVYFQMPPASYAATATFRVPGSGAPPLVIEGREYWSKVPANGTFMSHTFVVPADAPQVDGVYPTFAAAGSRVTLSGRNFAADVAGNVVAIGTERATVVSASAGSLSVTVPPRLPGGVVEVTVTRGEITSNAVELEVLVPSFQASTTSLAFGNVALGQTADRIVTVKNAGTAPLTLTSIAAGGAFSPVVPISARTPLTVDPGAERTITVRFGPRSAAATSGTLVIVTSDVAHRSAAVALSGTGIVAGPDLAASPAGLGFGSVAVGQSRTATVTLRNAGTSALTVTAATIAPADFALVSPAVPFTLAAGASQAVSLRFTPGFAVPYRGTLALASNDPDRPTFGIGLNGTGVPTGSAPSACTYGVSPASLTAGASAGSATVTVTAEAGCAWTASSGDPFVTVGNASGTGSGTVALQITANGTGLFRSGRLIVAGTAVDLIQDAEAGESATVPIVLTSEGLGGSFFTSELALTNRGQADAVAELTYTAAFGGGSGTGTDVVPAGRQLVFPDAISYLQSIGVPIPEQGNRGGTLRIRFLDASSASSVSATVRTASRVANGRAGLAYGSVPRGVALTGTAYLCGLRQNATDRASVAVVNAGKAGEGDVVVRLTVFSGDPASPVSQVLPDLRLPPGGFSQVTGILASNGLSLTNGWVKVEKVGGTAPYYAYAVINDQANSDGSFVPPVLADGLTGRKGITLPVAVEVSTFATELVMTNFGAASKSFRLTFVADGVQAPGNAAGVTLELKAGEQRIVPKFVQYLRDQGVAGIGAKGTSFAGAVFLSVSSGDVGGLFLGARTSAPGGGGTYGLFYSGVPDGRAATTSAYVYGLQQNRENRSNLGLVNTGEVDGSTDTFTLEIYDGERGSLVGQVPNVSLGPRRWTQLSGLLKEYTEGVTNGYVKVRRTAGNNPFIAYGVVNDGGTPGVRSDDGAFVPMDTTE